MALAESIQITSVSVAPFKGMENSTSSQRSNHVCIKTLLMHKSVMPVLNFTVCFCKIARVK